MLAEADESDWTVWDVRPAGRVWDYRPTSVPAAFQAVADVEAEPDARDAYTALLDALGHNHSGTPYPAMVPGVRLLVDLVPLVQGWQLATVLEVLTDCFLWTRSEGEFTAADGRKFHLGDDTAAMVRSLRPMLEQLCQRQDDEVPQRAAVGLLQALDDERESHG